MSPKRPILPSYPYLPPPPQAKLSPDDLTEYRLRQILSSREATTQVWQALVEGLRGMSPLLAREIVHRALGRPRATITEVEKLSPLLDTIGKLLAPVKTADWQPTIVLVGDQAPVYAPYPVTHQGEPQPLSSISQAIEVYVAAIASADPYAAAKRPVREAIAAARARLQGRREAMERSLSQAADADQWRLRGEWILAYGHTIIPGQTELLADTGTGQPLKIPLDPDLSAADNAQACFARYRKAQRAASGAPARMEVLDFALRDLEQLETDLELAASRPEIDEVRAALGQAGHLRAKTKGPSPKVQSRPLSLSSPDGIPILVGRNSRQNDLVTFRQAKGDDWWFHARDVPGAHVIVRSEGRQPPPATIRRAAELAAHFSRLRGEANVVVDYTQRRHVRRIPGAAPGLVTYSHEQTIRVVPSGPD